MLHSWVLRSASGMMIFVVLIVLAAAAHASQLPVACREGENMTAIPGCVPLLNDTVVPTMTVASGSYTQFHWAVGNYLDIDDASGNRRSITFEVVPCVGSVELYVRALQRPFPTSSSYDYASVLDAEPNAITVQMLRAQYFISVYGAFAASTISGPATFSIIAKISGKASYPSPGADGTLTVTNKFTESLLLPEDLMDMLVSFVPIPDASITYEYSVYSAPNVTGSPCGGGASTGACVKTTACGIEAAMTSRSAWQPFRYDGTNVTITATGLPQNIEQIFTVVGRPVGVNVTDRPDLTVVYTATTGTPEYFKESQLVDDNTIVVTLVIVGAVLVMLFIIAFVARRQLITVFQERAKRRKDEAYDKEAIQKDMAAYNERLVTRAGRVAAAGGVGGDDDADDAGAVGAAGASAAGAEPLGIANTAPTHS